MIHSTTDLTHTVKAKGTAFSVHAMKEYRGADVQLYAFLTLAAERLSCQLHTSALGNTPQYRLNRGWVGPKTGMDNLKKMKITFTARN